MLKFYAASFSLVMGELRGAVNGLASLFLPPEHIRLGDIDPEQEWQKAEQCLELVAKEITNLPLSATLRQQVQRAREAAKDHRDINLSTVIALFKEIYNNTASELADHLFLMVPANQKVLYTNPEALMGSDAESKFPQAVRDMHHGVRCFVLDEWTASVFHFMRVLEHGLRWLAGQLSINTQNITLENWKTILDQIEKKIREMEQLPKSLKKIEDLKFYSEAASNFRYFKDAWRNHVSHARATYDSNDARQAMTHVADFMKHLASRT